MKYLREKNAKGCCEEICKKSREFWERSGCAIDDITCVVGYFEYEDSNKNNVIINEINDNGYFNM